MGARAEATPNPARIAATAIEPPSPAEVFLRQPRSVSRGADIHADADAPAGSSERERGAGLLEPNGEHLVVDELVAHRLVATDPQVRGSRDENEASRCDRDRRARRAHERPRCDEGADQHRCGRLDRLLDDPGGLEQGKECHAVSPSRLDESECPADRVGAVTDIGVREQEPLPPCQLESLMAGPRLADPAGRDRTARDDAHAIGRCCSRLGGGRVRRLVVDDDHLERAVLLRGKGCDRDVHATLLVPCGNDHGHERSVGQWLDVVEREAVSAIERRHEDAPRPGDDGKEGESPAHESTVAKPLIQPQTHRRRIDRIPRRSVLK